MPPWVPVNILWFLFNFFGPTPIVGTRATTHDLMRQMGVKPAIEAPAVAPEVRR